MPDCPAYAPLLLRPDAPAPPVLSLPHSGTRVPEFLACALRPGAEQRLPGCDAHLPELLPDDLPIAAVVNPYVRAAADVNRSPQPQPGGPRTNCLFPLDGTDGAPLYRRRLTPKNVELRLARIHRPYHAALEQMLSDRVRAHGYAVLLDLHSFPADAAPGIDAVLGDLCGRSAPQEWTARLEALLRAEGLRTARNAPFPGGYILRRPAPRADRAPCRPAGNAQTKRPMIPFESSVFFKSLAKKGTAPHSLSYPSRKLIFFPPCL